MEAGERIRRGGFSSQIAALLHLLLDVAISTLGEAGEHLRDGIDEGYWTAEACAEAFALRNRAIAACLALKRSQEQYLKRLEDDANGRGQQQ